jgi:hypothetical protein
LLVLAIGQILIGSFILLPKVLEIEELCESLMSMSILPMNVTPVVDAAIVLTTESMRKERVDV